MERKNFALVVVACLASIAVIAQDRTKTELKEIYFRITNAFKYGDSMYVFAEGVTELGLKPGIPVNAYQTLSKQFRNSPYLAILNPFYWGAFVLYGEWR